MDIIQPKDEKHWKELRSKDITSTEIGALFGISPWTTEFELWHRKKSASIVDIEDNERMKWGRRLQDSIANGIAEDQKWKISRMDEYLRMPKERLGSSFDYSIDESPRGILEIKNVDTLQLRDKWIIEDDNIEAPAHIEIQLQHQLLVSDREYGYIGALIGGNKVVLIKRLPDKYVHKAILQKAKEFWDSIENNTPPKPDFNKDSEFISKLFNHAEPGKFIDRSNDERINQLVSIYNDATYRIKKAEEEKESAKSEILTLIQDAERVTGNGWTINANLVGPAHIEFDRKPYRNFKISIKKLQVI